ncbi:hypothetical protein HG535_0D03870 [Zygotorulaspora mrakii]|uniref:Metal homeostatis protein BSD2 n=1 Tax=Zygotorulaspora mrakii TaxID=42260 RepID=A0A7H9B412_ZYGMR|nr:uncharacterized protein HG535_0D03870 [Zygotorulaspora mrakii]QLG72679.1 hypothetical protein HG535_0D03870 [Zygotorulaspora mrakii]
MIEGNLASDQQQVGSSTAAREIHEGQPSPNVMVTEAADDVAPELRTDEQNQEEASSSSGLGANSFSVNLLRRIKVAGKLFNILDRIYKKNNQQASHLQLGANFDGVFSNLSAKPDCQTNSSGSEQDHPPTYDEAAVDMAPSYYGVDDYSGLYNNEICIEGLPVGNLANLIWNIVVSSSFQFIGFLITYILHTSHAAKQGSRFGLGITFLGYAYSMIPNNVTSKVGKDKALDRVELQNPNEYDDLSPSSRPAKSGGYTSNLSSGLKQEKRELPALAVVIGLLGGFIILKSIYDYVKVKKMEHKYQSQDPS